MSRAERVICEAEGGRSRERNEYPAKYEELLNQEFGFKARNDPHRPMTELLSGALRSKCNTCRWRAAVRVRAYPKIKR